MELDWGKETLGGYQKTLIVYVKLKSLDCNYLDSTFEENHLPVSFKVGQNKDRLQACYSLLSFNENYVGLKRRDFDLCRAVGSFDIFSLRATKSHTSPGPKTKAPRDRPPDHEALTQNISS